jgi:membrane protease YdiL (CAAX protease family)
VDRTKQYPGFWHAVLLCALFVGLQLTFMTPVGILDMAIKSRLSAHPAVLGIVNLVACAGVMSIAWLIGKPSLRDVFALRRVSAVTVIAVVLATCGAMILVSEMDNVFRLFLPPPEWVVRLMTELMSNTEHPFSSVFVLVMVAPITEELMFRGLMLRGFLTRFSIARAFLLSALLFAATHLNPWQFFSAFGLGILFAWWYARTGSLIPSLIGHALVNGMVASSPWLPFRIQGFNEGDMLTSADLQPLWFDGIGVALLAGGMWLFHRATPPMKPHHVPPSEPPAYPVDIPPVIPTNAGT